MAIFHSVIFQTPKYDAVRQLPVCRFPVLVILGGCPLFSSRAFPVLTLVAVTCCAACWMMGGLGDQHVQTVLSLQFYHKTAFKDSY